jgi:hypothetical protein
MLQARRASKQRTKRGSYPITPSHDDERPTMIFDPRIGALYGDDGEFIKSVHCPMSSRVKALQNLSDDSPDKYCHACMTRIVCIDDFSENDLRAKVLDNPKLCVFSTAFAKNITVLGPIFRGAGPLRGLKTIGTARSIEAMKDGYARGFRPLIKMTTSTGDIGPIVKVLQNKRTGEIWASWDRLTHEPIDLVKDESGNTVNQWELIADWFNSRPDQPFPLAAYMLPNDLQIGESYFIEDVIEDISFKYYDEGDSSRLSSCVATWKGGDFEIISPAIGIAILG